MDSLKWFWALRPNLMLVRAVDADSMDKVCEQWSRLIESFRGDARRWMARARRGGRAAFGGLSRGFGSRARGAWSGLRSLPGRLTGEAVPDDVLVERVRAKLGRYISHPHAIEVDVSGGRICLTGPALAH